MTAQGQEFQFACMQSRKVAVAKLEEMFGMENLQPFVKEAEIQILKDDGINEDTLETVADKTTKGHPNLEEEDEEPNPNNTNHRNCDLFDNDSSFLSVDDDYNEEYEGQSFLDKGHGKITTTTIKCVCTPLRDTLTHMLHFRPSLFQSDNLVVNKQPE